MTDGHGELLVRTAAEFHGVLVEIRDNGSAEYRRRSETHFRAVLTTKAVGDGTSLGLDTVCRIVQKHRDQVRVESESGRTSFQVRLPLATDSKGWRH